METRFLEEIVPLLLKDASKLANTIAAFIDLAVKRSLIPALNA